VATLRDIHEDLLALAALLYEAGGDVSDEEAEAAIDEWLAETSESMHAKLERYVELVKTMERRAATRKEEADRLSALASTDLNVAKRLKGRLQWFMGEHNMKRVDTNLYRITVAGSGGKVPVEITTPMSPEEAAKRGYQDCVRVSHDWDKDAIRRLLENGDEGVAKIARLGERGRHLRIG
jgi:hypothetical protein